MTFSGETGSRIHRFKRYPNFWEFYGSFDPTKRSRPRDQPPIMNASQSPAETRSFGSLNLHQARTRFDPGYGLRHPNFTGSHGRFGPSGRTSATSPSSDFPVPGVYPHHWNTSLCQEQGRSPDTYDRSVTCRDQRARPTTNDDPDHPILGPDVEGSEQSDFAFANPANPQHAHYRPNLLTDSQLRSIGQRSKG